MHAGIPIAMIWTRVGARKIKEFKNISGGSLLYSVFCAGLRAKRIIGLDALGIEQDVRVAAPHSSITLNYPLPRLARLKSVTAAIYLTPNSQLSGETVFFFYYNDKLVGTRTAKSLRQEKPYVIKLPVDGPSETLSS